MGLRGLKEGNSGSLKLGYGGPKGAIWHKGGRFGVINGVFEVVNGDWRSKRRIWGPKGGIWQT